MSVPLWQGVLTGGILSGTPVLYATLGEILVQRAGMVNLGLEGTMLMGASVAFVVTAQTGEPWLGLGAGALAGGLFQLTFGWLVISRRANQLASGLAVFLLGLGLSAMIGQGSVGSPIRGFDAAAVPGLSSIKWIGPVLFNQDVIVYMVAPVAVLVWWGLFHTRWGLHLRAVGENREAAFAAGLNPTVMQYQAVFLGGLLGGLGGAHLSIALSKTWIENMAVGQGFIAVALVIFSMWHPLRAIFGALLFGGAVALQLQLQARGANISPFILTMLPYILTLFVLMVMSRRQRHTMPEGLNAVFEGTDQ